MYPGHDNELRASAAQLLNELQTYEGRLDELVNRRWDPELYVGLADHVELMRPYASALTSLTRSWTDFLITRLDFSSALWAIRGPSRINGRVLTLHTRHKLAVAQVRRDCQAVAAHR